MPCNSDYMDASPAEIYYSQVMCLLEELDGKEIDSSDWRGYHKYVYNGTSDRTELDKKVWELCDRLSLMSDDDIKSKSLELQMWWRDHKIADAERIGREKQRIKEKVLRKKALDKLTSEEKKLLGIG